jgi:hypothetical protein
MECSAAFLLTVLFQAVNVSMNGGRAGGAFIPEGGIPSFKAYS